MLARLANKEAAEEVLGGNALSYSYMEVHTDEADFDGDLRNPHRMCGGVREQRRETCAPWVPTCVLHTVRVSCAPHRGER